MKSRVNLSLIALLILGLALAGCGGSSSRSGGGPNPITLQEPDHSLEAVDTTGAIAAARPSGPPTASDEARQELGKLEREGTLTDAQMRSSLAAFARLANDQPGDVAAQTGISLVLAAVGVVNAARVLGADLPEDIYVPVAPSAVAAKSLKVGTAASRALELATQPLQLVPRSEPKTKSSSVRPRALVPGATFSTQELQSVLAELVLPCFALAIERLDYLVSNVPDGQVLVAYSDVGGESWNIYRHDLRALSTGLKVVYTVALIVNAYNWDWGSYGFDRQPWDMDTNNDGILTVNEYAPASPFLTLMSDGAANLATARTTIISAGETAYELMAVKPTDLHSPLGKVLEDADATNLDSARKDILSGLDLFKKPINIEAEYAWYDWEHDTFTGHKTVSIPVNLPYLFVSPLADLKTLFPQAYITPDTGWYQPYEIQITPSGGAPSNDDVSFTVDNHSAVLGGTLITDSVTQGDLQARRVTFADYDGAGHALTVNWNVACTRIWGSGTDGTTFDTISFDDDVMNGESYRQVTTTPDDIPDRTLNGLFPDPDKFWADFVVKKGSPDILLLRYGHIEANLSDDWAWSMWSSP